MYCHVVPPSDEYCHRTLGFGLPVAVEGKVTVVPIVPLWSVGCVATVGTVHTVSVTMFDVAVPALFVNTAR